MSLAVVTSPLIKPGWIRAVLLLIIYVTASTIAGWVTTSTEMWIGASFFLAVSLVYLFRRYIDKKSFESLGLDFALLFPHAITGLLLSIFLVSLGTLTIFFLKGIEWIDISGNLDSVFFSALLMLMVAVAEELVFRGYMLKNLIKSVNPWVALLITSLLFTLVHAGNPGIPAVALFNTFLGGVFLGIAFLFSRSLWMPVLFHFGWNFFQGPVFGFEVSGIEFDSIFIMAARGNPLISGGEYGFEGSAIGTALLLACVAGAGAAQIRKEKKSEA